jgi:hypothetical protein
MAYTMSVRKQIAIALYIAFRHAEFVLLLNMLVYRRHSELVLMRGRMKLGSARYTGLRRAPRGAHEGYVRNRAVATLRGTQFGGRYEENLPTTRRMVVL